MANASPASAPMVVGRYALYGKIASGGMATVYFGRMVGAAGFTRTVAIKRLHPHLAEEPDFVSMMIDEARLAARVQHPNVAQTLDVVAEAGELLVVMEYVSGDSLARLLRVEASRQRHVPLAIASAVINGALHGLHAAHEAKSDRGEPLGIVHRDVSPHNVLVGVDGMPRVIDFGVAKAAGRLQTTRAGVVKGKVPYMAPEHLGGAETTRMADIYAAGVVLWETITGRRMHRGEDDAMLLSQVLAGATEAPSCYVPGLPPLLDAIVMRALARDPAARFQTAREFADALVRAIPPALPTDVGAWVEHVARQVLDARSAQLADIESHSSVSARPSAGGPVSTSNPPPGSGQRPTPSPVSGVSGVAGPRSGPPASRRAPAPHSPLPLRRPPDDDELPTVASQPSAASQPAMTWPAAMASQSSAPPQPSVVVQPSVLSMAAPAPPLGVASNLRTPRSVLWLLVGAVGLLVLAVGVTVGWRAGARPTSDTVQPPIPAVPLPAPPPTQAPTTAPVDTTVATTVPSEPSPSVSSAPAPASPGVSSSSATLPAPRPVATTPPWAVRPPPPAPARTSAPPARKPVPSPAGSVIFATPD